MALSSMWSFPSRIIVQIAHNAKTQNRMGAPGSGTGAATVATGAANA